MPDAHITEHTPEEMASLPFPCHPDRQKFAIISCVAPPGWGTKRTANVLAFRVYGIYETEEEADKQMKKAYGMGYTYFDMFVVDIRDGFIPLPPPTEAGVVPKTFYGNKILEEIMRGHRDLVNESSEKLLAKATATPSSSAAGRLLKVKEEEKWKEADQKEDKAPATAIPESESETVALPVPLLAQVSDLVSEAAGPPSCSEPRSDKDR